MSLALDILAVLILLGTSGVVAFIGYYGGFTGLRDELKGVRLVDLMGAVIPVAAVLAVLWAAARVLALAVPG
jgi:hypothetical protein